MANFYKNFTSDTLMSFGKSFARLNGQPLDKSAIWYSKAEADAYAATGSAYVGQPVAVIDETNLKTTLYIVGANSTLEPVGIIPAGDEKTIEVSAAGAISLLGAATAADGTLPMLENGALVWKSLEQIGAGDGNDNTTYEFSLLEKGEGDAAEAYGIKVQVKENGVAAGDPIELALDVYTKSEIDATIGGLDNRIKALEDAEDADTTYSVKEGEKILKLEGTEFSTVAALKYVEAADEEPAKIQLLGIDNAVVSEIDATPFIRDGMLSNVEYDAETNTLTFTWNTAAGEMSDTVVLSDIIEPYTAGNGLELTGNEFAVKVDTESEAFLSVGENGLKLAGVQDAINTAAEGAKSGALTEVANNYYNKTEVYNKEEVYNKNEVYAKTEVYTKGEADKAIADKITEVNGGESAGEVLAQLTAYEKIVNMEVWGDETGAGDENGNSRIDTLAAEVQALKNVGSQANVIEAVKVNGTALTISEKAVDIAVPTMLSQLDGYTGIDERITAAQNTANNAQTAANEAKGAAAANAAAIEALTGRVTPLEEAKSNHEARIKTLEDAKTQHDSDYATLAGTVAAHTEAIAKKAEQSALNTVSDLAAANEQAIKALTETTIPGINEEIGKKANAADVYAKADVYTKAEIGTIEEGKTIIKMIEEAQAAASYDDGEVRGLIGDNAAAIEAIYVAPNGETPASGVLVTEIARVEGLVSAEQARAEGIEADHEDRIATMENFWKAADDPEGTIDKLAEIVKYIEDDKTGALDMAADIQANADAIAAIYTPAEGENAASGFLAAEITRAQAAEKANADAITLINDGTNGILAQAKKYTDDSIAALPFATTEKAGLVKSSSEVDKISVAADGTMEINSISTSKIFNDPDNELVLNGGGAAGYEV